MNGIRKIIAKLISAQWKNLKLKYYLIGFIRNYIPTKYYRKRLPKILAKASRYDENYLKRRVDYYNQLAQNYSLEDNGILLKDFKYNRNILKSYFFDTFEYTRYFNSKYQIAYNYGDVIDIPKTPSIVKSRPIAEGNENSVLLNLNKVRHFVFVKDKRPFTKKEFKLVWRGNVFENQENRVMFVRKFHKHPLCDVGHLNETDIPNFSFPTVQKMTLYEHLKYKFIISLEGNDVATNLKWIMSSNSITVMPKPRYETWFMEGTLIPDYHYICVKDDFSDMVEKVTYYNENPVAAQAIIQNANEYVKQFKNKKREKLISLLVLKKYFELQTQ